jgi:TrmH family RNA methyltransferase
MKYSRYKKESNYTYAYGAFASFEALTHALSHVKAILLHEKLKYTEDINKLLKIARSNNIEIIVSSKDVEVLAEKENTFVITVIEKYNFSKQFDNSHNQVVLVNPMNSGNLGTIMRAMIGFGVNNLAIITPSTDIFDPKVIRASQGSIFSLNIKAYDS